MKKIFRKILLWIMNLFPIKKKLILFESNPDLSDSTYALYLYIVKNYPQYRCIWLVSPSQIEKCREKQIQYISVDKVLKKYFFLSTCKYFFYTHNRIVERKPRKGQYVYDIWHGSPGKKFKKDLIYNKDNHHIFVTSTSFTFEKYRQNYDLDPKNYLLCNHPRNDFFDANFSSEEFRKVEEIFHISQYKKTIIWLPTFKREKKNSEDFLDNFSMEMSLEDFKELNLALKSMDTLLVIKLHPMVVNANLSQYNQFTNIRFLKSADLLDLDIQLYSLIGCCDALISDFSSVVYDFMMLDRPIGYVLTELESYKNNKKEGFIYDDFKKLVVGDMIYNLTDLIGFINKIYQGIDSYKVERNELAKLYVGNQKVGSICEYFCQNIKL